METIDQAMELIAKKRKASQIITILYAAVLLSGLLLLAFGTTYIGIGVCAAALILYFFQDRPLIFKYQDAINLATVKFGIAVPLEELKADVKEGGLSREEFKALELLPIGDTEKHLLCRNNFSGKKGGMTLTGSEVTVSYLGGKQLKFVSGTLLTAAYDAPSRTGDWLMFRNNLLEKPDREKFLAENGYHQVEFTSDPVQNRYSLYTRSDAREIPEWLLRRMVSLIGDMKVVAAIRLKEGAAAVYLRDRFYTFNVKMNVHPTPESMTHNYLEERDDCWNLFKFWGEGDKD